MADGEKKWYVLRTAGGKEKKAKEYLEKEIEKAEAARRAVKKPVSVGGAGSTQQKKPGQSKGGTFTGDSNVDTDF